MSHDYDRILESISRIGEAVAAMSSALEQVRRDLAVYAIQLAAIHTGDVAFGRDGKNHE